MSENWQVQALDGSSVSDHQSEGEAREAADVLEEAHQTGYRVRRTA